MRKEFEGVCVLQVGGGDAGDGGGDTDAAKVVVVYEGFDAVFKLTLGNNDSVDDDEFDGRMYEVKYDDSKWRVSGKTKGKIKGRSMTIPVFLIPIRVSPGKAGDMPRVEIEGVSVRNACDRGVMVAPKKEVVLSLERVTRSGDGYSLRRQQHHGSM
jgi:hypothetical protein